VAFFRLDRRNFWCGRLPMIGVLRRPKLASAPL